MCAVSAVSAVSRVAQVETTGEPQGGTAGLSTALRFGRKTFPGRGVNTEISPLRYPGFPV